MKRLSVALIGLIIISFCTYFIEKSPQFTSSKRIIQAQTVPSEILAYGSLGRIMKRLNVVSVIPRNLSPLNISNKNLNPIRTNLQQKSPLLENFHFKVNPGRMRETPSSLVISRNDIKAGWPLLSIVVNEDDLYDPIKGILVSKQKRGQEWERLANISYFEDGKLVFATGAGVRVHGSNVTRNRDNIAPGFRLYFRDAYGVDRIQPGIIFDYESKPIKHLVVTPDMRKNAPFIHSMAYEISQLIGAQVPEHKPVMLFLNGEFMGTYSLVERLHKRQWEYHFGHDNFAMYRYRSTFDEKSAKLHDEFKSWALDFSQKMTTEEAKKRVNLENMSRHIIFIAYCGNTDWEQGAAVIDLNIPNGKWSWICWDLNHCFLDLRSLANRVNPPRRPWEQESFELVSSGKLWFVRRNAYNRPIDRRDVRTILFSRLIKESPEYRDAFITLVQNILNHRLTADLYLPIVKKYRQMAIDCGFKDNVYNWIERFFENRPKFIRKEIVKSFGAEDWLECKVRGPYGITYKIDGYPESSGYQGMYIKGKKISVKICDRSRDMFSHWIVNGEKVEIPLLEHKVLTRTLIKPVFKGER